MTGRHLTARELAAQRAAQAAVARVQARARTVDPPPPEPDHGGFITPARARAIRLEAEQDQHA